jgi:hypothetical protein
MKGVPVEEKLFLERAKAFPSTAEGESTHSGGEGKNSLRSDGCENGPGPLGWARNLQVRKQDFRAVFGGGGYFCTFEGERE